MINNEAFQKCDYFGTQVSFYYKGKSFYTTKWGAIVSILIASAYLLMIAFKIVEFYADLDPIYSYSDVEQSMEKPINLSERGFSFAI